MSTIADLPVSAKMLTGPQYAWKGSQDNMGNRSETYSWSCPWSDSNAFYAALVGTSQTFSFNGISISRNVPLQHPFNPRLYASSVSWTGINGYGTTPSAPFAYVIFSVVFSYPPYSVGPESSGSSTSNTGSPPFTKVSSRASIRSVTDTSRQYTYNPGAGAVPLQHDVGVNFGGNSFEITLFALPNIDAFQSIVAPMEGKVNSQNFMLGAFSRAPGTVLLEGYGFEIEQNVLGDTQWTATVSLNCSSLPWNSYVIGGGVYPLSPSPYQTADLNALYM